MIKNYEISDRLKKMIIVSRPSALGLYWISWNQYKHVHLIGEMPEDLSTWMFIVLPKNR